MQEHPDKGGDPEQFKLISRAYEILSNPEKRAIYDVHGERGAESAGNASEQSAANIFSQMFGGGGGGGGGGGPRAPRKSEDIIRSIPLTLAELYSGKSMGVNIQREVLCTACKASGCVSGTSPSVCGDCEGRGVRVVIRHMGPMVQHMQQQCAKCRYVRPSYYLLLQTSKGKKATRHIKILCGLPFLVSHAMPAAGGRESLYGRKISAPRARGKKQLAPHACCN